MQQRTDHWRAAAGDCQLMIHAALLSAVIHPDPVWCRPCTSNYSTYKYSGSTRVLVTAQATHRRGASTRAQLPSSINFNCRSSPRSILFPHIPADRPRPRPKLTAADLTPVFYGFSCEPLITPHISAWPSPLWTLTREHHLANRAVPRAQGLPLLSERLASESRRLPCVTATRSSPLAMAA